MTVPDVTPEMVEAAAREMWRLEHGRIRSHDSRRTPESDERESAEDGYGQWDRTVSEAVKDACRRRMASALTAALAAAPAVEINPDDWMISCDRCGRQVQAVEWFRDRGDRGAELVRAVLVASGWECDDETGIDTCPVCLTAPADAPTEPGDDMCPNCVTPWKCNGPHIPTNQTEED